MTNKIDKINKEEKTINAYFKIFSLNNSLYLKQFKKSIFQAVFTIVILLTFLFLSSIVIGTVSTEKNKLVAILCVISGSLLIIFGYIYFLIISIFGLLAVKKIIINDEEKAKKNIKFYIKSSFKKYPKKLMSLYEENNYYNKSD